MTKIHSTSIIAPSAEIEPTAEIGPFCIVGAEAVIGADVKLHSHVVVKNKTILGPGCELFPQVTVGERGQVLGNQEGEYRLEIGANSVLRENVTIHASEGEPTRIGEECYFMYNTHVGHDCKVGNKCVLANGSQIGGHCVVGDQVWLGGGALIHQKSWIGDHAFIGAGSILVGDVIPFASTVGNHAYVSSINVVGLRRRGFDKKAIMEIRRTIREIYIGEGTFKERIERAKDFSAGTEFGSQVVTFASAERSGRPLCQFGRDT